jgi:hypothetical protein
VHLPLPSCLPSSPLQLFKLTKACASINGPISLAKGVIVLVEEIEKFVKAKAGAAGDDAKVRATVGAAHRAPQAASVLAVVACGVQLVLLLAEACVHTGRAAMVALLHAFHAAGHMSHVSCVADAHVACTGIAAAEADQG